MMQKKQLIQKIINVFETGQPEGKYDQLVIYADGIENSKQITFGRCQTTEQANLLTLVEMYVESEGAYCHDFIPYLDLIGNTPLHENKVFKNLLITAAQQDEIMRTTQDRFFDEVYWAPALAWCEHHKMVFNLSALVVYDSYIHSGRIPMFLRKRFTELPPLKGGDEKAWIRAYVGTRHQWLKYHSRPILRKTLYRTQTFINEIERDNWNLEQTPIIANGISVS